LTLARVAIPSPNYSSGRGTTRILCLHTSEGAEQWDSLGAYLAQSSSQVSYQAGFDDRSAAQIGVYVHHYDKAWAALDANSLGEHACFCTPSGAAAGWTRADWLARDRMLQAAAAWCAEEATRYGIPLQRIDGAGINAGRYGICDHWACTQALGGSHTDVGAGFPWDVLLAYALGAQPFPEPKPKEDVLIGQEWYPMAIFASDDDARQAAVLTWWATYLSAVPSVADLAHWSTGIKDHGYAGCLNMFLAEPNVKERMAARPW